MINFNDVLEECNYIENFALSPGCRDCRYYRIDEETGEGYCKQTYTKVYPESSCDSFVEED